MTNPNKISRGRQAPAGLVLGLLVPMLAIAQAPPARTLPAVGLPVQANDFRTALPGMLDQRGHERRTLSGTVISHGGQTSQFTFTRELDQKVRLDLNGPAGQRSSAATNLNTSLAPALGQSGTLDATLDADLLELLADDMPEALLFSYGTPARIRWLGTGFRTDGGNQPTATSALYDVFLRSSIAATQSGSPMRDKSFLFDSRGKLLQLVRYQIERSGATVNVEVAFTGWSTMSGQTVPTTITRSENGSVVFTITINAAASSATQQDNLFNP